MKAKDLHTVWDAPDNSRLTSKQHSFRLPVHVAAKIDALCEIYPTKTRTQLVGDLLAAALDDVERAMPSTKGKEIGRDSESGEMVYQEAGMVANYRKLVDKHYIAMEKARGNKNATALYGSLSGAGYESDFNAGSK